MSRPGEKRRILLAITEASPLQDLWRAVIDYLEGAHGELTTVFFSDDRWHRAASLPFTREVSKVSGDSENFTRERAQQIDEDTVGRTHRELEKLASEAELPFAFEVLPEHDASTELPFAFEVLPEHDMSKLREIVSVQHDVLILPSFLKSRPIYAELTRVKCRVYYVDGEEEDTTDTED